MLTIGCVDLDIYLRILVSKPDSLKVLEFSKAVEYLHLLGFVHGDLRAVSNVHYFLTIKLRIS
jgi:hypothetical protein